MIIYKMHHEKNVKSYQISNSINIQKDYFFNLFFSLVLLFFLMFVVVLFSTEHVQKCVINYEFRLPIYSIYFLFINVLFFVLDALLLFMCPVCYHYFPWCYFLTDFIIVHTFCIVYIYHDLHSSVLVLYKIEKCYKILLYHLFHRFN